MDGVEELVRSELVDLVLGHEVGVLETVERCLLTGGPSWTVLHCGTGRRLTVALDPGAGTFSVWCRGSSWTSGVGWTPGQLREAVQHVGRVWSDMWSAERERVAS